MTAWVQRAKRYVTPLVSGVTGLLAVKYMHLDAYKDVTQELIALFGLMMAGVLPTMVLTASVLRPGNLSVRKLIEYQAALMIQLRVWIGLFVLSLSACLLITIGKMASWKLEASLPISAMGISHAHFWPINVLNGLITLCISVIVLRGFSVGRGVISLLSLSSEIAVSEARLRDADRHQSIDNEISAMKDRPGFGEYVELKH